MCAAPEVCNCVSAPLLAPSARVKASSAAQLWLVICAQLEQCCSAQFHARVVRLNAALCVFAALLAGCQGARRGQPLGLARAHGLKKGVMHEVRGGLHLVRRCLARVKCVLQQQYSSNGRECELKQKSALQAVSAHINSESTQAAAQKWRSCAGEPLVAAGCEPGGARPGAGFCTAEPLHLS